MAASDAAIIDVEDSSDSVTAGKDQLQFQEFKDEPDTDEGFRANRGQTHMFTSFPDSVDDDTEHSDLLGEEKRSPSIWNFEYYQSFYNVDTNDVVKRIIWSMIPRPGYNFLQYHIRPNPDLYGPFWICTTLIFTIAVMGNLANYLKVGNRGDYVWQYDFHKVTLAAATIYAYASITPLLLWVVLWYRRSEAGCTFLEILCIYGYSLSIYVPVSILWVIQLSWLQWLLVLAASFLSGSVLVMTFWPTVKNDHKNIAFIIMLFIMVLHILLAVGFLLYFFYVPNDIQVDVSTTTSTSTLSTTTKQLTTKIVTAPMTSPK